MASPAELHQAGERVEELLRALQDRPDPEVVALAEDLVRELLSLYGAALGRVMELVGDGETGRRLAGDPLLSALLVLHDIHPEPVGERIERALDAVRPHLGSHAGGVEFLGVDAAGVAHLSLRGSCHGCSASELTVKGAVEQAVLSAAPEVTAVEVEGMVDGFVPVGAVHRRCPAPLDAEAGR